MKMRKMSRFFTSSLSALILLLQSWLSRSLAASSFSSLSPPALVARRISVAARMLVWVVRLAFGAPRATFAPPITCAARLLILTFFSRFFLETARLNRQTRARIFRVYLVAKTHVACGVRALALRSCLVLVPSFQVGVYAVRAGVNRRVSAESSLRAAGVRRSPGARR